MSLVRSLLSRPERVRHYIHFSIRRGGVYSLTPTKHAISADSHIHIRSNMKLFLFLLLVAAATCLAVAAPAEDFDRRLSEFSRRWEKHGARELKMDSAPVASLGRRLRAKNHRKLSIGEGFQQLIGAAQSTIGVVNGAVGAVQQVLNLFGKQSSESLVGQFTNQGFSKFNQNTRISATTLPTAIFDSWAKDAMKNLYNVPKKHSQGIKHMVKYAKYVDNDSWLSLQGTFDISSGGQSNQIQLFTSRDTECERMNVVFIVTSTKFKLKPDLFIISKSSSRLGGAFSETKLQWKSKNAALKTEDLKFVSEYFLALGMGQIQQSQTIAKYAGTRNCGDYKPPPKQINPFKDEDEDDLGGGSLSVSGGVSGQSGGTNYNANFGYKNEWDEDDNVGGVAGAMMSPAAFKIARWGQRVGPYLGPMKSAMGFDQDDDLGRKKRKKRAPPTCYHASMKACGKCKTEKKCFECLQKYAPLLGMVC